MTMFSTVSSLVLVVLVMRAATSTDVRLQLSATQQDIVSQRLDAMEARLNKLEEVVAFHVHFSADPVYLGPSQRLLMNNVVTNVGNAYDVASGEFRAPVSGTYVFVVHFMTTHNSFNYVLMMLDGQQVGLSISHDRGVWDRTGETVVLHLTAGQRVWLIRDMNSEP